MFLALPNVFQCHYQYILNPLGLSDFLCGNNEIWKCVIKFYQKLCIAGTVISNLHALFIFFKVSSIYLKVRVLREGLRGVERGGFFFS